MSTLESKKLDFNFSVEQLDGSKITVENNKELLMSTVLASAISNIVAKGDGVIKYYTWAKKLSKNETLELDYTDFKAFRDIVANLETITLLAKGQALQYLETI